MSDADVANDVAGRCAAAAGDPGVRHHGQLQHHLHLPRHRPRLPAGTERCRQKRHNLPVRVSFMGIYGAGLI